MSAKRYPLQPVRTSARRMGVKQVFLAPKTLVTIFVVEIVVLDVRLQQHALGIAQRMG